MDYTKIILKNYKRQTQQFTDIDDIEPCVPSRSNQNQECHLLYDMWSTAALKKMLFAMTTEEVHQSVEYFSCDE